ncbi:MAG: hypothetical protein GY861_22695 [bacterium]|nr:hypothetical protein [bacterium]
MPKGGSGGKRTAAGGGGIESDITMALRSSGIEGVFDIANRPAAMTVSQVESTIMSNATETMAIFGNDRKLLMSVGGAKGEVTLSQSDLKRYKNDIRTATHNHPIDLPLSTGDLISAAQFGSATDNNFEELRAVSKNGNVYRVLKPANGKWPTESDIQKSIQKNIRTAYKKAIAVRNKGGSKDEAFRIYQDELTKLVAKDTGMRLRGGSAKKPSILSGVIPTWRPGKGITLGNITEGPRRLKSPTKSTEGSLSRQYSRSLESSDVYPERLRTVGGRPTFEARRLYGMQIPGEKEGAFPVFDVESAISALKLRGRAQTVEGRADVVKRAATYAPEAAARAAKLDKMRAEDAVKKSLTLRNITPIMRTPSGRPTKTARSKYGLDMAGEKRGSFPVFDITSAQAALRLRGHAKTTAGRREILRRAAEYVPEASAKALQRDLKRQGINLKNVSEMDRVLYRTLSGKPSAVARREYGTKIIGEKPGSFPIFDVESAAAALHLRGRAKTTEGRRDIVERAGKYLPQEASQALRRDVRKQGISMQNVSKEIYSNQRYRNLGDGKPTAEARKRFGFKGIAGEKTGAFPVFDVRSAKAALFLRYNAKTGQGRRDIINRAKKFAPEVAERAAMKDIAKGMSLSGVSFKNKSVVGESLSGFERKHYQKRSVIPYKEYGASFDKNRQLVSKMYGGPGFVVDTTGKKVGKDVRYVTHTHPNDRGFSNVDILNLLPGSIKASGGKLKEFRSTTKSGIVSVLGKPKGGWPSNQEISLAYARSLKAVRNIHRSSRGEAAVSRTLKDLGIQYSKRSVGRVAMSNTALNQISVPPLRSLNTGRPTIAARRKHGFRGLEGEREGAFPVFDERSAKAALRLRGKAMTSAGRRNVIERAGKYLPQEANRALSRDLSRQGITLRNVSNMPSRKVAAEKPKSIPGEVWTGLKRGVNPTVAFSKKRSGSEKAEFWRTNPYTRMLPGIAGGAAGVVAGVPMGPGGMATLGGLGYVAGAGMGGLSSRLAARRYRREVLPKGREAAAGHIGTSLLLGGVDTVTADAIEGTFNKVQSKVRERRIARRAGSGIKLSNKSEGFNGLSRVMEARKRIPPIGDRVKKASRDIKEVPGKFKNKVRDLDRQYNRILEEKTPRLVRKEVTAMNRTAPSAKYVAPISVATGFAIPYAGYMAIKHRKAYGRVKEEVRRKNEEGITLKSGTAGKPRPRKKAYDRGVAERFAEMELAAEGSRKRHRVTHYAGRRYVSLVGGGVAVASAPIGLATVPAYFVGRAVGRKVGEIAAHRALEGGSSMKTAGKAALSDVSTKYNKTSGTAKKRAEHAMTVAVEKAERRAESIKMAAESQKQKTRGRIKRLEEVHLNRIRNMMRNRSEFRKEAERRKVEEFRSRRFR